MYIQSQRCKRVIAYEEKIPIGLYFGKEMSVSFFAPSVREMTSIVNLGTPTYRLIRKNVSILVSSFLGIMTLYIYFIDVNPLYKSHGRHHTFVRNVFITEIADIIVLAIEHTK